MKTTRVSTGLSAAFAQSHVIGDDDRVLVAVSGGPDSMALLHLLHATHAAGLDAAHFDHQIRPDSARDGDLVEAFCAERGIGFHFGTGDVPLRARLCKESIEEAARKLRYEFLDATALSIGANRIATAHTLDDHVETVLMRLLRGSGIRGIAGIPRQRGRIVRPLLSVRRTDVLDYCREHRVPFVNDPTNSDTRFTRNRIRHEVLPRMRRLHPGVDDNLVETAERASRRLREIRRITEPIVARHLEREGSRTWRLPIEPLAAFDDTSLYVLFADVLTGEIGCDADTSRCHYEMLASLVRGQLHTGARLSLPGLTVRREHDGLVFSRTDAGDRRTSGPTGANVGIPGTTRLHELEISCDVVGRPAGDMSMFHKTGGDRHTVVAYFARDSIVPPLRVRRFAHGDRMRPFGMRGHKKLSDIFIDRKIPYRRRQDAFVVEDQREIVWLVGVTTSESTRVTEGSASVVRLTAVVEGPTDTGVWAE